MTGRVRAKPKDPDGPGRDRITVGAVSGAAAIGAGAQVIINQAVSAAEQADRLRDRERKLLADGVARLAQAYQTQISTPPSLTGSPYNSYRAFAFAEAGRFHGRENAIQSVVDRLACPEPRCSLTVLDGDTGAGKTSLLHAGIAPRLISAGHLAVLVNVSPPPEPLDLTIKRALLPELDETPGWKGAPLHRFLQAVVAVLPPGRHVFLLLDQFEAFFQHPQPESQPFLTELSRSLEDVNARDHWLLCIRSSARSRLFHLTDWISPGYLENSVALPLLTREEARQAMRGPADDRKIPIADPLIDALLQDLDPRAQDAINSTHLQIVCQALFEKAGAKPEGFALADYDALGRADRLLQNHLQRFVDQAFDDPARKEQVWQLLAAVMETPGGAGRQQIDEKIKPLKFSEETVTARLKTLVDHRVLIQQAHRYLLAGAILEAPIRQWQVERRALEKATGEIRRQVAHLRGSALRGLIAGFIGFGLAYLIAYACQTVSLFLLPIAVLLRGLPGGLIGLGIVLALDLIHSSLAGRQARWRWLAAAAAGALIFGLGLAAHAFFDNAAVPGALIVQLFLAGVEGGLWGALAGVLLLYALESSARLWPPALAAGGAFLLLLILEPFMGAFSGQNAWTCDPLPQPLLAALAGAVMTGCLAVAARLGRER